MYCRILGRDVQEIPGRHLGEMGLQFIRWYGPRQEFRGLFAQGRRGNFGLGFGFTGELG